MKNAIILLGIICAALIATVWFRHKEANKQFQTAVADTLRVSNQLEQVNLKLTEQIGTNATVTTNLASRNEQLAAASNHIARLKSTLAKAEEETQSAQLEIKERDSRINDWEASHGAVADKANELRTSLGKIQIEITDLKKKLDASEGDREFLLQELKDSRIAWAKLVQQFNDIAVVRAQFEKLREEKFANKRSAWANTNPTRPEYKGAEVMAAGEEGPWTRDRKVELQQDGSVRLVPTTTGVR